MDRREKYRQHLSKLYLPYYDALCSALPPEWQPYYGIRSFQEQDRLYAQGRTQPGRIVTNARAGESAHNYGCATDWCLWVNGGKTPLWPVAGDKRWKPYVDAVKKLGLKSGADFSDYPHNELKISCSWKHVLIEYKNVNMTHAQQHIEKNLVKV